ncbi:hypothetical protein KKB99_03560 [bacterium]|nr:hypothetical protein [bacterium]MBU1025068.1 hypothetical protein [bacterium]
MGIFSGCGSAAPLKIEEISITMPGDNPSEFDVYRVVAVKQDVTKRELVGLIEYFTKTYIDKNRVKIYVFNNVSAPHLGQSKSLVATYFQDSGAKKYEREILLDQPD